LVFDNSFAVMDGFEFCINAFCFDGQQFYLIPQGFAVFELQRNR